MRASGGPVKDWRVHIFGSGPILGKVFVTQILHSGFDHMPPIVISGSQGDSGSANRHRFEYADRVVSRVLVVVVRVEDLAGVRKPSRTDSSS